MRHPNAASLAKRLLDSRIKRLAMADNGVNSVFRITKEETVWAEEILATHLDACLSAGVHVDLCNAVDESLEFAIRREKAYDPIPPGVRWHGALVMFEEGSAA